MTPHRLPCPHRQPVAPGRQACTGDRGWGRSRGLPPPSGWPGTEPGSRSPTSMSKQWTRWPSRSVPTVAGARPGGSTCPTLQRWSSCTSRSMSWSTTQASSSSPHPGVPVREVGPDPTAHGHRPLPADPGLPAAHVCRWVRPDRQHLFRTWTAGQRLQVGLSHRKARPGGVVQGDGARGRQPGSDEHVRQPRLRVDPARLARVQPSLTLICLIWVKPSSIPSSDSSRPMPLDFIPP